VIAALFTKKLPKLAPSGSEVGAGEVGSGVGGAIKILAARTIIDSSSVMCIFPNKKAEEVQPVRSWLEVGQKKVRLKKSEYSVILPGTFSELNSANH